MDCNEEISRRELSAVLDFLGKSVVSERERGGFREKKMGKKGRRGGGKRKVREIESPPGGGKNVYRTWSRVSSYCLRRSWFSRAKSWSWSGESWRSISRSSSMPIGSAAFAAPLRDRDAGGAAVAVSGIVPFVVLASGIETRPVLAP